MGVTNKFKPGDIVVFTAAEGFFKEGDEAVVVACRFSYIEIKHYKSKGIFVIAPFMIELVENLPEVDRLLRGCD